MYFEYNNTIYWPDDSSLYQSFQGSTYMKSGERWTILESVLLLVVFHLKKYIYWPDDFSLAQFYLCWYFKSKPDESFLSPNLFKVPLIWSLESVWIFLSLLLSVSCISNKIIQFTDQTIFLHFADHTSYLFSYTASIFSGFN